MGDPDPNNGQIRADGMPVNQYMVGRDGGIIEKLSTVYSSSPTGAIERFEHARADIVAKGGVDAPDYVVILLSLIHI